MVSRRTLCPYPTIGNKRVFPEWDISKEQRLDWLVHYEVVENEQFLQAVANGGDVGQLRLRLGIILKETCEFIGWCCTGIKDELLPSNREIMFAISKHYRNKGYTTQAAQGMINFLFEKSEVKELNAIALIRNISSNRVIRKCGFEFVSIIQINEEDYCYYKLGKNGAQLSDVT